MPTSPGSNPTSSPRGTSPSSGASSLGDAEPPGRPLASVLLLSHPTGNANVRHAALGLLRSGLLSEYWTCLAPRPDDLWIRALPRSAREQALRRTLPPDIQAVARTRPLRELGRFAAAPLRLHWLTRHESGPCSVDGVYRDLDRAVARRLDRSPHLHGVYAYEDGAADSFAAARRLGLAALYDLPIGYWRAGRDLQVEEAGLQPAWAATMPALLDSPAKLARKDLELASATAVFVASRFTAATLERAPARPARIHLATYGPPLPLPEPPPRPRTGPLRILFVGSLSQRKGLAYLLAAVDALGPAVSLTLVGRRIAPCTPLDEALARHRWIETTPHGRVLALMREHDVLAFPSLFEGFGLVILEALAQALPVIATPNTAAPEILTDGTDGFVVPIRDTAALRDRLARLASDRDRLQAMQSAALAAARRLSWETYGDAVAAAARSELPAP